MREEAILLLRRFYVQENGRAPEPRRRGKEGRALKGEDLEVGSLAERKGDSGSSISGNRRLSKSNERLRKAWPHEGKAAGEKSQELIRNSSRYARAAELQR